MVFLEAKTPQDYQELFYKKIGLARRQPNKNTICWEDPQTGYIHSFGDLSRIQTSIGNYTIPLDFFVEYKYKHTYFHFGIVYEGITYSLAENNTTVQSTPCSFFSIEKFSSGVNHWKKGEHFKGIEISIDMDYLYTALLPVLGMAEKDFSFLQTNIRYSNLSEELRAVILRIETLISEETLTPALQTALTLEFLALVLHPDSRKSLCYKEPSFTRQIQVGNRSIRMTEEDITKIVKARERLRTTADTFPTIYTLSRELHISEPKLKAGFLDLYQQTIWDYANNIRMDKAVNLLRDTNASISSVSQAVGYQSKTAFNNMFKKWSGVTPRQFRIQAQSGVAVRQ